MHCSGQISRGGSAIPRSSRAARSDPEWPKSMIRAQLRVAYRSAAAPIVRRMSDILRNRRNGSSGEAMKPRSR